MHKVFQYRIYPTKKQARALNDILQECRWLYNHLLQQRKTVYEQEGTSLTCYSQINTFAALKQERSSLNKVQGSNHSFLQIIARAG